MYSNRVSVQNLINSDDDLTSSTSTKIYHQTPSSEFEVKHLSSLLDKEPFMKNHVVYTRSDDTLHDMAPCIEPTMQPPYHHRPLDTQHLSSLPYHSHRCDAMSPLPSPGRQILPSLSPSDSHCCYQQCHHHHDHYAHGETGEEQISPPLSRHPSRESTAHFRCSSVDSMTSAINHNSSHRFHHESHRPMIRDFKLFKPHTVNMEETSARATLILDKIARGTYVTDNFNCEICGKQFGRMYNLKSHLLSHQLARPFACTTCGAKFSRNHDLNRHVKIHNDDRPYRCEKCGKGFIRRDALNRHLVQRKCSHEQNESSTTLVADEVSLN